MNKYFLFLSCLLSLIGTTASADDDYFTLHYNKLNTNTLLKSIASPISSEPLSLRADKGLITSEYVYYRNLSVIIGRGTNIKYQIRIKVPCGVGEVETEINKLANAMCMNLQNTKALLVEYNCYQGSTYFDDMSHLRGNENPLWRMIFTGSNDKINIAYYKYLSDIRQNHPDTWVGELTGLRCKLK